MNQRLASGVQQGCLVAGALLLSVVAFARLDAESGRLAGLEAFAAGLAAPDQSLWSAERIRDYEASLAVVSDVPVAVLRVRDLALEVPVYATDSELHLNRGAGLIAGMGLPDKGGNLGIAGHRDGFFRVLKDIRPGQLIEVETRLRTHRYRVVATEVVDPTDLHVLADTLDPTLTLVTCYPFYFLGSAPRRFIIRAAYDWS